MVYNFSINSEVFEEECCFLKIPSDKEESELVSLIIELTDNNKNDMNKTDNTIDRYKASYIEFHKLISLPHSEVATICLCASAYKSEANFIKDVLNESSKNLSENEIDTLTKRMYSIMYTQLEFNKMYIYLKMQESTIIDDINQTATISVKQIETKFISKEHGTLIDNEIPFSNALRYVGNYYYTGIEGFLLPDKKLAIYYIYISFYLKKINKDICESERREVYSDLLDMYIDTINDINDINIIVHSFSKLKKLDADELRKQEEHNLYIAIKAIMSSKTISEITTPNNRNYVSKCCMGCGAMRKLKTCANCKVARFCSIDCIRSAWTEHKPHCNRWATE